MIYRGFGLSNTQNEYQATLKYNFSLIDYGKNE